MLRLAFDFIITWRETRTRPNAYHDFMKEKSRLTVWMTGVFIFLSSVSVQAQNKNDLT